MKHSLSIPTTLTEVLAVIEKKRKVRKRDPFLDLIELNIGNIEVAIHTHGYAKNAAEQNFMMIGHAGELQVGNLVSLVKLIETLSEADDPADSFEKACEIANDARDAMPYLARDPEFQKLVAKAKLAKQQADNGGDA